MKITNEQLKQMIQEELEEVLEEIDEGYMKKYGTGEDYSQRRARQDKMKQKPPAGSSPFKSKPLPPMAELEAHMTIAALRDSNKRARVSQEIYDYIEKIAPAITDRLEIKE